MALRILVPEHMTGLSLASLLGPSPHSPTGYSPRLLRHWDLVLLPGDDGSWQPFNVALKPSSPILLHHLRLRVQREACECWGARGGKTQAGTEEEHGKGGRTQ